MRAAQATSILAFAAHALGHGYIWRIDADNTAYPGWDVRVDPTMDPVPERIAFGGGDVGPAMDSDGPEIACNRVYNPRPLDVATVRAGSNISFHWSHWLHSHKGPITAWLAPYGGDIADVDVNKLEFFKFAEDAIDKDGVWATDRLMANDHVWTAVIPADIKPGNYVIRHEIIALHFVKGASPGFEFAGAGPQFYMTCFNVEVSGNGTATPTGMAFPGAYQKDAPGLWFDLDSDAEYPFAGPPLYKSEYEVELKPNNFVVLSPTGQGEEADALYYAAQNRSLQFQETINTEIDANGG